MKKIFFLTVLTILSIRGISQDTIVLINNQIIISKIIEVNSKEVKYKRFEMPDGPDFIEKKSNIRTVKYKNGVVDELLTERLNANNSLLNPEANYKFVQVDKKRYMYNGRIAGESKMFKIMSQKNDPELNTILYKMKGAKKKTFILFGAIPAAVFTGYSLLEGMLIENSEFGEVFDPTIYYGMAAIGAVATVGLTTTGLIFSSRHKKYKAKAVKTYNEKF